MLNRKSEQNALVGLAVKIKDHLVTDKQDMADYFFVANFSQFGSDLVSNF